jgi:murein tripeptide amidase MpaA
MLLVVANHYVVQWHFDKPHRIVHVPELSSSRTSVSDAAFHDVHEHTQNKTRRHICL